MDVFHRYVKPLLPMAVDKPYGGIQASINEPKNECLDRYCILHRLLVQQSIQSRSESFLGFLLGLFCFVGGSGRHSS